MKHDCCDNAQVFISYYDRWVLDLDAGWLSISFCPWCGSRLTLAPTDPPPALESAADSDKSAGS